MISISFLSIQNNHCETNCLVPFFDINIFINIMVCSVRFSVAVNRWRKCNNNGLNSTPYTYWTELTIAEQNSFHLSFNRKTYILTLTSHYLAVLQEYKIIIHCIFHLFILLMDQHHSMGLVMNKQLKLFLNWIHIL